MKTETIKVLLIDDDEDDFILTRELLSEVKVGKYELDWAPSYEEGLKVSGRREHQVCLVDYRLGEHSGVQLIRQARESGLTTPMILLTGQGNHEVDVEAMEAGAIGYLIKDETPTARLERTIRYAIEIKTEHSRAEAVLGAYAQKHAAVAELGRLALIGTELKELFVEAVSLVTRTLGVEYCELLELLPDGDALILKAGVGWKTEVVIGQTTTSAAKESQAGFTLLCEEPVIVENLRTETRFSDSPMLREHGVLSGMSVIIRGREHPYGVLGVYTTSARKFAADDVNFLRSVANVLAEAIGRKRAEDEVRNSESQFRALFDHALDAVLISDDVGVYVDANPAACALLGARFDEIIGHTVYDFIEQDYIAETSRMREQFLEEGTMQGLFSLRRLDGKVVEVDFSATANFIPGRHLSVLRDVTEQRKLEEQLRQSQKLESVGLLAGGIAHDFNNLLTVITGYSDLTLMRLDKVDPLARNVEQIVKATERATSLTRQLLAFSRKQVLQPKVLDLNSVIVNIEKMLGRLIGEDMELSTSLGVGLGHVKVDPGQIEQVIFNLTVNARDAMPKGGKITLETANIYLDEAYARQHLAVQPGWHAMLAVTDTGCGMEAETQKSIFEPFFTTKEQGKGTGLGLSTVYGIVKQSGGNIWVYSEVGVGTTFKIYLPLVDEHVTAPDVDAARPESIAGTEMILLVEDEEMVRNLARESLRMHGYTVLEAANAREALLICQQHEGPIHLLLTDVVMPRMSGRELAEQLVRLRPDMSILYMSGYPDQSIVHHGILDEDIAFIGKPFTPDALVLKVAEVLQQNVSINQVLEKIKTSPPDGSKDEGISSQMPELDEIV
jgi:PAS domain S-box-containing protein